MAQQKLLSNVSSHDIELAILNEEDETNTVIENECDNDYTNLYQSFEVEEETEEMRR